MKAQHKTHNAPLKVALLTSMLLVVGFSLHANAQDFWPDQGLGKHQTAIEIQGTIGEANAPDESASTNASSPPFFASSMVFGARFGLSDAWEAGLRLPLISVSVLQPGGSTLTEVGVGNLVLEGAVRWELYGSVDWDLDGKLSFGAGVPLACLSHDDVNEEANCGAAFTLANALSGWTAPELYQRDAIPLFAGFELQATHAAWQLGAGLRLPVFIRIQDDASPLRNTSDLGVLPTLNLNARFAPWRWFAVGIDAQVAQWTPTLVEPQGGSSGLQVTLNPHMAFAIGDHVAIKLEGVFAPGGDLDSSYATGLGVESRF